MIKGNFCMNYKCLIDMDGVITDWVGGACDYFGVKDPYTNPKNYAIELMHNTTSPVTKKQIYEAMEDHEFWINMKPLKHARTIVDTAYRYFGSDNVSILSKPAKSSGSVAGKFEWIQKYFPDMERKFIFGMDKSFCARRENVLLDDLSRNVKGFIKAGGIGYLFPALHNTRYQEYINYMQDSDDISEWLLKEIDDTIRGMYDSN